MEISRDGVSIGKHTTTTCSIALQRTALHWNTEHTLTLITFPFIPLRTGLLCDRTQSPIHWLLGTLFRGYNDQYAKLATDLHPVSKFRVSGAITSALHASSWFGGYAGQLRLHHIHKSSKFLWHLFKLFFFFYLSVTTPPIVQIRLCRMVEHRG